MLPGDVYYYSSNSLVLCVQQNLEKEDEPDSQVRLENSLDEKAPSRFISNPTPFEFCLGANIGSSVFVPPAFSLHILWIKGMKKKKLNTSAIIEEYTR